MKQFAQTDRAMRLGRGWLQAPVASVALLLIGAVGGDAAPDRATYERGETQFPGERWQPVESPEHWGWDAAALADARSLFDDLDSAAVAVVHHGVLIAGWGDLDRRYNTGSIRKPFLGALIGQEIEAGRLDLEATLADLGIDDRSNPLTPTELGARVVDLLQSRGAVYLPAVYESPTWKRYKPERGAHAPGETWFYSNWGFNALGTIFEKASGTSVHEAFRRRIAEPIEMEDYREKDVDYLDESDWSERMQGNDSEHPAGVFMMSTRDLARFGLLYSTGGRWGDEQVVPAAWVDATFAQRVDTHPALGGDRYGYLWWVSPFESELGGVIGQVAYQATGGRGHKIVIVPDLDLVVAHQLATGGVSLLSQLKRRFLGAPSVDDGEFNELMRRIVAAHPDSGAR